MEKMESELPDCPHRGVAMNALWIAVSGHRRPIPIFDGQYQEVVMKSRPFPVPSALPVMDRHGRR